MNDWNFEAPAEAAAPDIVYALGSSEDWVVVVVGKREITRMPVGRRGRTLYGWHWQRWGDLLSAQAPMLQCRAALGAFLIMVYFDAQSLHTISPFCEKVGINRTEAAGYSLTLMSWT